jgi:hypothetical protein
MEAVDARHLCVDFGVNHSPEAISQSLNAYPTLRPLGRKLKPTPPTPKPATGQGRRDGRDDYTNSFELNQSRGKRPGS